MEVIVTYLPELNHSIPRVANRVFSIYFIFKSSHSHFS